MNKRMSRVALLTLLLTLALSLSASAALTDLQAETKSKVQNITPMELNMRLEMGEEIFILDIRNYDEWLSGHIPGATHVHRDLMEMRIESLVPDYDTEFVVNCKSGGRSLLAAEQLMRMGYKNVLNLEGGMLAWIKSGYPIQTDLGTFVSAE